jgi:secreted Zn-dependent insulinase-like peptidase
VKPQTLQEAVKYFADPDNCMKWLIAKRKQSRNKRREKNSSHHFTPTAQRWP